MMDFLFLKMVALIFYVFLHPGSSNFLEYFQSKACAPKNDALSCICKNREDISLSPSMNFNIRQIQVSGCGVVTVPFGFVTELALQKIIFSDISTLIIQPFALAGALNIYSLQIEDIAVFNVWNNGFGLSTISDIIIRNISSMSVETQGFSGISTVENFTVNNVNFTEITRNAFDLSNVTAFKVVDCKMNVTESNTFLIHTAEIVLFQNCSIQEARNHSFSMADVDSVIFSECDFGVLDTNSIHLKYAGSLQFENCTVSKLNKHAFSLVDLVRSFTFTHNIIKFGYDSPLHLKSEKSSICTENKEMCVFTESNYFLCDCDIYWMWISEEPFYDIKTSICIGTNASLSDITFELDSNGNCTALNTKNLNVTTNLEKGMVVAGGENTNVTFPSTGDPESGEVLDRREKTNATSRSTIDPESGKVLNERENANVTFQAVSAGALSNIPIVHLVILYGLLTFICSL